MSLRKMEENLGSGRSSVMSVLVGIIIKIILITIIIIMILIILNRVGDIDFLNHKRGKSSTQQQESQNPTHHICTESRTRDHAITHHKTS